MNIAKDRTTNSSRTRTEYVQSLERGLAVIKAFGEERQQMTVAEVARAVGITRGAARRFLLTLQELGYVTSTDRYYSLRPNVLELGYAFLSAQPWWRYAQRIAQQLATRFQEPCAVGVLDETSVVYVCYASAQRFSVFSRAVGTRLPAYPTAVGRALLSGLDDDELSARLAKSHVRPLTPFTLTNQEAIIAEVRKAKQDGFSYVDQELEIGLASFGVPVLNRSNQVAAAISMSFPAKETTAADLKGRYLKDLRTAATEISVSLVD